MNRKKILNILIFLIVVLVILLIFNRPNYKEDFVNISRTNTHEEEYIEPILRQLYSDKIQYIGSNESNESQKSADLILAQNFLPQLKKPYILMNGEPNLRHYENNNNQKVGIQQNCVGCHVSHLYFEALKDPYCVGCVVSTLDFNDKDKTFYVPLFLDRGHVSFTSSPFIRKYTDSERPNLAAYIATHSPPHRDEFFKELRALDSTVDGLGRANHTKDVELPPRETWWELSDVYKTYKFGFAMENKSEHGYITEKIMNVYLGGAIPLFWGTPVVKQIFNPESFVYLNDFSSLKEAAKYVYDLSKDESKLKAMREAPIFIENSPYEKYWNLPAPQWVTDIATRIEQNIQKIKLLNDKKSV
jgi:hypothetical protein